MVVPATHGSVLLGPTADDAEDKYDRSTHEEVLARVWRECWALVPALADAPMIKSFAGLRPASDRTYRIERSEHVANVIQAGGIRSTGVSASPAVGDYVRDVVIDAGLNCQPDPHAVARIPKRTRLADGLDGPAVAADPRCSRIATRDVPALVKAVVRSTSLPVICAGSVGSADQIQLLAELGVWGFTIGTVILELQLVVGRPLVEQVQTALDLAA
jgi:glycerol-3-phosphate dehydrogenase